MILVVYESHCALLWQTTLTYLPRKFTYFPLKFYIYIFVFFYTHYKYVCPFIALFKRSDHSHYPPNLCQSPVNHQNPSEPKTVSKKIKKISIWVRIIYKQVTVKIRFKIWIFITFFLYFWNLHLTQKTPTRHHLLLLQSILSLLPSCTLHHRLDIWFLWHKNNYIMCTLRNHQWNSLSPTWYNLQNKINTPLRLFPLLFWPPFFILIPRPICLKTVLSYLQIQTLAYHPSKNLWNYLKAKKTPLRPIIHILQPDIVAPRSIKNLNKRKEISSAAQQISRKSRQDYLKQFILHKHSKNNF